MEQNRGERETKAHLRTLHGPIADPSKQTDHEQDHPGHNAQRRHPYEIRWETYRSDARLLGGVRALPDNDWQNLLTVRRPQRGQSNRHIGPIATGDKVISFSRIVDAYRDVWVKLVGVEMEAGGVATAVYQSPQRPGFFMIRSASDFADLKKNDRWRGYACDVAASYTVGLLRSGPITPSAD